MTKFKVFMPAGTVQTIIAGNYHIEWKGDGDGILRFWSGDDKVAVFPPGGWHGVQDMEPTKKVQV